MAQILLNNSLTATQKAAALRRATMMSVLIVNPDLSREDASALVRKKCGASIDSQLQAHLKHGIHAEMGLPVNKRCKHTMPKAVFTPAEKDAIQTKMDLHAVFLNGDPVLDELGRMVAVSKDAEVKATAAKRSKAKKAKAKKKASKPKAQSSELKTFMTTADEFSSDLRNRILTQGTDVLKDYVERSGSKVTQKEMATMPIVNLLTVFINAANAQRLHLQAQVSQLPIHQALAKSDRIEELAARVTELVEQNEELIQANADLSKSASNGNGSCVHDFQGQLADIHDGETCAICDVPVAKASMVEFTRGYAAGLEHVFSAISTIDEFTPGAVVGEILMHHWKPRD